MTIKTIDDVENIADQKWLDQFSYQEDLTKILDRKKGDFDQNIINEILLWKVNRYAELNEDDFSFLNRIDRQQKILDENLARAVLKKLISRKGIRLPVASTILRFKNPHLYQIIDQRVYRILYGYELKLSYNIENQIDLYLRYLDDLRKASERYGFAFEEADRILFTADRDINKDSKIKY